jgi:lipopolysaccharide transport system ATP-binding protein
MYVRLAFAVAAHLEPEVLVVDEVLAVGDAEFQKKCLGKMKDVAGQGRTVLFVSHNMNAINRLCENSILLENGMLKMQGKSPEVVSHYLTSFLPENLKNEVIFEPSEKDFQILEAKVLTQDQQPIERIINTESDIYITLKYHFKKKINKLHLTIYFKNSNGEIVYFIDRAENTKEFACVEPGIYSSIIQVPNPLLKPGQYSITLGCSDNQSNENDHKFDVLNIEITSELTFRNNQPGLIYKPVIWDLNRES